MTTRAKPFVFMNLAMSADGKITSAAREHPKFTSANDRQMMQVLRARADAVLVGAGTLRADDPGMQVRDSGLRTTRSAAGKSPDLWNVVVSRSGQLPTSMRFFRQNTAPRIVVATAASALPEDLKAMEALGPHVEVWRSAGEDVDLPNLLGKLHARGIENLLVEGGGALNFHLFAENLVDEIHITVCPSVLGGAAAPTWVDGAGFSMATQKRLELVEARVVEQEIFCHWRVIRGKVPSP